MAPCHGCAPRWPCIRGVAVELGGSGCDGLDRPLDMGAIWPARYARSIWPLDMGCLQSPETRPFFQLWAGAQLRFRLALAFDAPRCWVMR